MRNRSLSIITLLIISFFVFLLGCRDNPGTPGAAIKAENPGDRTEKKEADSRGTLKKQVKNPLAEQNLSCEVVSVTEFCRSAKQEILKLGDSRVQKEQFSRFCKEQNIEETPKNFRDYLIAKMNFEGFRHAGYMRFTYVYPFLDEIASPNITLDQLKKTCRRGGFRSLEDKAGKWIMESAEDRKLTRNASYAFVECDTAAAFYAYMTQKMGVDSGLIWPTWNHTIAYAMIGGKSIKVPITELGFLDSSDLLGTNAFSGGTKGPVNPRYDGGPVRQEIPKDFADTCLQQIGIYGNVPDETIRFIRYSRNVILSSDRGPHVAYEYSPGTPEERDALNHFMVTEGKGLKKANPEFWEYVRTLIE